MRLKPSRQADATRIGILAELEFERRLFSHGYVHVMRPARTDQGVDFCVWTSRGWMGIQVKASHNKKAIYGGRRGRRTTRMLDLSWGRRGWGKSYYTGRGVQVFAVWIGTGFYLVPSAEMTGESRCHLNGKPWLYEAWHAVLGTPLDAPARQSTDGPIGGQSALPLGL